MSKKRHQNTRQSASHMRVRQLWKNLQWYLDLLARVIGKGERLLMLQETRSIDRLSNV